MLQILDVFFTLLHLVIILFNLVGWILPTTRKLHFYCVLLTAASWLVLGIFYGIGYCPVTDWQWQVKERLGEENLPNSFIKYVTDKVTGSNIKASLIDSLTAILFFVAAGLSVYFNFIRKNSAVG
jgi:hypothetical protein